MRAFTGWRGSFVLLVVLATVSVLAVFAGSGSGAAVPHFRAVAVQRRSASATLTATGSSPSVGVRAGRVSSVSQAASSRLAQQSSRSSVAQSRSNVLSRYRVPLAVGEQVAGLSRRDSDTFRSGSGRLVTKVYPAPVNYRTAAGRYVPIDTQLVAAGSGFVQRANDLGVRLPKSASLPTQVSEPAGGLSFALQGASGTGSVSGTVESFPSALPGAGLSLGSEKGGVAWRTSMTPAAAATGLSWSVKTDNGLTAKLVSDQVEFVNRANKVVWVFLAPTAETGSGKPVPTTVSLVRSSAGYVIHVGAPQPAPARGLAASYDLAPGSSSTEFVANHDDQVTWEGQIIATSYFTAGNDVTGDCYIDGSTPDDSLCGGALDYVGPSDSTLLNIDVSDNVPQNVEVLGADLIDEAQSQSSSSSDQIGAWAAGDAWNDSATWNSYDGTNDWTTPGGDTTGAMLSDSQVGGSGTEGTNYFWDLTSLVQSWVDQSQPQNGLILKSVSGSNTIGFGTFADSGDIQPYLEIYYQQLMGDYPNAKYDTQQLTDRSSEGVNVANGNLLLSNSDVNLAGVNGLGLNIGRYYNNLASTDSAFGTGWSMGAGQDSYLAIPNDGQSEVYYFDGTGAGQPFSVPPSATSYQAPPGLDATLSTNDGTNDYVASTFTMYFRHSGITETFTAPADDIYKVARLTSITDRNGNTIAYHYNSSGQLTSIVDSYGNTTTIDWSPEGFVDEITDPTGREYRYFQNSDGQLTEYEDPAGHGTYYGYDSYGNLTQVTTPAGNITKFSYDAGNSNEVDSVQRLVSPSDSTGPTTTYQMATASGTCSAAAGAMQDTVSDPNGHVTTYCTDPMGRLLQVVDAAGHMRSTSYTADGYVSSTTSALGTPTSFSYSGDGDDNVTQIQQGATGGGGSGTGAYSSPISSSYTYGTTTGDNQYLPTQSTDGESHSSTYAYDSSGNTSSITDPLSAQNQASYTYNSNGTIATSTDQDGNETTYGYTAGNLTTVTPPSGSGLNATTLTYDSANRVQTVSTVSGSTGSKVTYAYNDFDQITSEVWQNAAGSTVETIDYTYDDDGNLLQIEDNSGSTTYAYDGLNRMTSSWPSTGQVVSYGYDAASNLTSVQDSSGTVTYTYNNLNEATAVEDPGASSAFAHMTYDASGDPLATTYASGVSDTNVYNNLGQLTKTTDNYKTSSGTIAHLTYTYTYNADGLQASVEDVNNNTTTYSYDNLQRLTEAETMASGSITASREYQYAYNGDGDLLQQALTGSAVTAATTTYKYNAGNEICWADPTNYTGSDTCSTTPSGGYTYSYDADGNQTSNGNGLTQTYNALNQMTSATVGSSTTDQSYISSGQDDLTVDGANTLTNSNLGVDASASGANTTYFTHTPQGQVIEERLSSGSYDYLYDGDGNVVGLTDSSGHLQDQYAYDPYGNKITNTGSVPNPFGFQAGYTTASGLIHYGDRFYNPTQGSWTQRDPLDQISDLTQNNRYGFVSDDPVNAADPTGDNSISGPINYIYTKTIHGVIDIENTVYKATTSTVPGVLGIVEKLAHPVVHTVVHFLTHL